MKLAIIVVIILTVALVSPGFGQTVITVTSEGDDGDNNIGNGVCDTGAGKCTLRAAMEEANALAGKDTIEFDIPGAGVHTIQPSFALPVITDPVVIDGYTQKGASPNSNPINLGSNALLMIEIDGTNAGDSEGFTILSGNSMLRGMVINRFSSNGIDCNLMGGNTIEGNFIGTDVTGTVSLGNRGDGVLIVDSQNNLVGGVNPEAANLLSGNGAGTAGIAIFRALATGNQVKGNFIGTDVTGTLPLGNGTEGVLLFNAPDNIIGGITEGARNIISGNSDVGVIIFGADATGNLIQGNHIGTDVTGTLPLGNGREGIRIIDASNTVIGGTIDEANVIAFNFWPGVTVRSGTGNKILSNSIFGNQQIGIDLWSQNTFGLTENDPGDADTGPNNLQNYPQDMIVEIDENRDLLIEYRVDSDPSNSAYPLTVQFFESIPGIITNNLGELQGYGNILLGAVVYTLSDFNTGIKTVNIGKAADLEITVSDYIVATVTDSNGNTSEFSFPSQVGIAGLEDIMLSSTYAVPGNGIVAIAALVTADTTGFSIFAEFESPDNTPLDTLQLFDDGIHSDGSAGDGNFGNIWEVPEIEERVYFVDIQVTFSDTVNLESNNAALFTSIGPVVVDSFSVVFRTESSLLFRVTLKNDGLLTTATDIGAKISTSDSCITSIVFGTATFGDIGAGDKVTSSGAYSVSLNANCADTEEFTFNFDISSESTFFWSDTNVSFVIVGIEDEINIIPEAYSLNQNYPNPFNPMTTIEYTLPKAGDVSLIVYNLLGEKVTRLISKNQQAGYYKVTWNASNVTSGIYFYRLQAEDFIQTRKMVLLK